MSRRVGAAAALMALIALFAVPAASAATGGAATVLKLTNTHRTANDKAALIESEAMSIVAQNWAKHLAKTQDLAHNPSYSKQIPSGWTRAAENVAYNCGYAAAGSKTLVAQWKKSTKHNENMLHASHTHIGVGVATDSKGCTWGVQVFATYSAAKAPAPAASEASQTAATPVLAVVAKPKITGKLRAGSTVKASAGTWSPKVTTTTYQWYRNGKAITGAKKAQYKLTTADRGKKITVKVTAKRSGYKTTASTSAAVAVPKVFSKAAKPKVTGTAKAGKVLTVKKGTWSPKPAYTYQWYRNGKAITGATKSTYTVKSADKGKKITVKVTGKKSGYVSASKTSASRTVAK